MSDTTYTTTAETRTTNYVQVYQAPRLDPVENVRARPIFPEHAQIDWADYGNGPELVKVEVTGPIIRKDGTRGVLRETYSFWLDLQEQRPRTPYVAETPQWLLDVVEANRPARQLDPEVKRDVRETLQAIDEDSNEYTSAASAWGVWEDRAETLASALSSL
jgi:hypothetical protein